MSCLRVWNLVNRILKEKFGFGWKDTNQKVG